MNILVTGGTGYIGSHTVVELINAGHTVSIIDNLSNSKAEVIDALKSITGKPVSFNKIELCDYHELNDYMHRHRNINAIVHFAASILVDESVEKPLYYYKNNLL